MTEATQRDHAREQVCGDPRRRRFALVAHENLDGDALGSLIAMQGLLRGLGKDSVIVVAPEEFPLPPEYRFFALDGLCTPADDLAARTVDSSTAATSTATRWPRCASRAADQHRPPPRQHPLRHDQPRRRGGLLHRGDRLGSARWLGLELTPTVAEALYVGLVTDTGRFCYENTAPRPPDGGRTVDPGSTLRAVPPDLRGRPVRQAQLLGRALASGSASMAGPDDRGPRCEDFAATGADDSHAEGIVDHLRASKAPRSRR